MRVVLRSDLVGTSFAFYRRVIVLLNDQSNRTGSPVYSLLEWIRCRAIYSSSHEERTREQLCSPWSSRRAFLARQCVMATATLTFVFSEDFARLWIVPSMGYE